ncbi:MAG: ectoine hydroxylase [Henriciella sp.]|jgi:ectoine hydroxylase|uniref:ectoine hydroxylase n=1 Tax=Henriciella sp. TaxID=1968823 RepID=UPI000C0D26BB|nr:ectoine hydroxylase [Henriciella sp.]MAN75209.1 ectoine hydroxylase [Henriciella sp.]MBF34410.1 ectoine hydroxylase [Hyphomonadaceae bacterium]MBK75865.1 ectoine hydroxylase [Henriciella sp.]PHR80204.1 MAG: ectoine hydroxylase [Henriciella sp.]|tara:strand:- start:2319 stop:3251 length:933 start_codon:yes stop_codon:yes gene_type:complete
MQQLQEDRYTTRLNTRPEQIGRRDPVIHAARDKEPPVSSSVIQEFEKNGFVVLEDVFSEAEVARMKGTANEMRDYPDSLADETVISERDSGAVRSVFAIHRQTSDFDVVARDPRLAELARHILGDDVYIHQSRLNYKPAFKGKEFYWHSDFETWHAEDGMPNMRALSMSVMLTDNHPQAGPVMFVPGSHKTFISCVGETPDDNYKASLKKQETGIPDADSIAQLVDEGGIVAPAPKAGSVVIFDCNTLHASNGNITPFERMNAFFVFNAWSNRLKEPYGANAERPEHIAHRRVEKPLAPLSKVTGKLKRQ